jgi:hypothetical protein
VNKAKKKDRRQSATKLTSFGSDEARPMRPGPKKASGEGMSGGYSRPLALRSHAAFSAAMT